MKIKMRKQTILIITVILLLIFAGITNLATGEKEVINVSQNETEEITKAKLKEKIELAIAKIQTEELAKGKTASKRTLVNNLPLKLENITAELVENQIKGKYSGYNYVINENNEVKIKSKRTSKIILRSFSDALTVNVGETKTTVLTCTEIPKTVEYSSANEKIATVDSKGIVTGIKEGSTIITVTITNDDETTESETCRVTVEDTKLEMENYNNSYEI